MQRIEIIIPGIPIRKAQIIVATFTPQANADPVKIATRVISILINVAFAQKGIILFSFFMQTGPNQQRCQLQMHTA